MTKAPVFIKIDEHEDIMNILALAKDKIIQVKDDLAKIDALTIEEERIFDEWKIELGNVEARVQEIVIRLPEPEV